MEPCCRTAVVVGGSNNGFGYVAADQLLHHGAKRVILADFDLDVGTYAAERLNRKFGNNRVKFVHCDVKSSCQIEALFQASACLDDPVSILFNDIDAIQLAPDSSYGCCPPKTPKVSLVQQCTTVGFAMMSKEQKNSAPTSIIFNCASILGIMGWPKNPEPVYCQHEHSIHSTFELAKLFPFGDSGVRVVALCPSKRNMENIGIPLLPRKEDLIDFETCGCKLCTPDISKDASRLGEAFLYLMAGAESGTSWLIEPPFTLRERPLLLDFARDDSMLTEKEKQEVARRSMINVPSSPSPGDGTYMIDVPLLKAGMPRFDMV